MPSYSDYKALGYGDEPHPFWKALEGVVSGIRGLRMSGSQTPWGFHEPTVTAGQAVGPAMAGMGNVLSDPRNAWMGLGPVAGMARFRRVPDLGIDAGGFHLPTARMRQYLNIPRPNHPKMEVPSTEQAVRDDYMGSTLGINKFASAMQNEADPLHSLAIASYLKLGQADRSQIDNTMKGLAALQGEIATSMHRMGGVGGSVPPKWFTPKK